MLLTLLSKQANDAELVEWNDLDSKLKMYYQKHFRNNNYIGQLVIQPMLDTIFVKLACWFIFLTF